jgi:hypothetical protein
VSPWKVILATMVIFCCGVLTGALVIKTAFPQKPQEVRGGLSFSPDRAPGFSAPIQSTNFLRRMQSQLALTSDQTSQIAKIMVSSQDRTKALWASIEPDVQRELSLVRAEIVHVLNPDQQQKFTDMLAASRPRRPEGGGLRDGDSFRGRTNHMRTNVVSSNGMVPMPAVGGTGTNEN